MMVHRIRLPGRRSRGESPPPPPSRLARLLALAHLVENLVEGGQLSSYSGAARRLGVTRARMSQIRRLLALAAPIQEAILMDRSTATERKVRAISQRIGLYPECSSGAPSPADELWSRALRLQLVGLSRDAMGLLQPRSRGQCVRRGTARVGSGGWWPVDDPVRAALPAGCLLWGVVAVPRNRNEDARVGESPSADTRARRRIEHRGGGSPSASSSARQPGSKGTGSGSRISMTRSLPFLQHGQIGARSGSSISIATLVEPCAASLWTMTSGIAGPARSVRMRSSFSRLPQFAR